MHPLPSIAKKYQGALPLIIVAFKNIQTAQVSAGNIKIYDSSERARMVARQYRRIGLVAHCCALEMPYLGSLVIIPLMNDALEDVGKHKRAVGEHVGHRVTACSYVTLVKSKHFRLS